MAKRKDKRRQRAVDDATVDGWTVSLTGSLICAVEGMDWMAERRSAYRSEMGGAWSYLGTERRDETCSE